MLYTLWCFVWCFVWGLPLGWLAAVALLGPGAGLWRWAGAAAAGLLLAGGVRALRRRHNDPDRDLHLATAAGTGGFGAPAIALADLGVAPGAAGFLLLTAVVLAVGLGLGFHRRGAASLAGALGVAAGAVAGGAVVGLVAAAIATQLRAPERNRGERLATAVYDLDAEVATQPVVACESAPRRVRALTSQGAHPRFGGEGGRWLWYDALDPASGRRQVRRLDRIRGEDLCWTCDEPGNNRRPAPDASGGSVVFDSDRHVSAETPVNTELYGAATPEAGPRLAARRLTFSPGPDDRAIPAPRAGLLVWSRSGPGGYFVASASLQTGHGGVVLGNPGALYAGKTRWTAPLAWSRDARALFVIEGQPLSTGRLLRIDPATGQVEVELETGAAATGHGVRADRGLAVGARARSTGLAAQLPHALGFAWGRLQIARGLAPRLRAASWYWTAGDETGSLDLARWGDWGEPTGATLTPDGAVLVIGQRRTTAQGVEERLLEIALDCGPPEGPRP
ncbi:MAG: hypothetical protein MJE66_01880 [Proteobacteria bacterium]|nr:hypothetical protein [Pseudomonadota bacterium]